MSSSLENMSEKQLLATYSNHQEIMQRIKDELKSRKTDKSKKVVKVTIKKEPKKEKSSSIFNIFSSAETTNSKDEPKKKKNTKDDDDESTRPIKATVASIKEVLDYHHIDYPSSAKKDELCTIVRKAKLVRECEKKDANNKA